MERCFKIVDFDALQGLKLEVLKARRCSGLEDLRGISNLPLIELDLSLCLGLEMSSLDVLEELQKTLKDLDLSGLPRLISLEKLLPLRKLERLEINGTGIRDLSDLNRFPKITAEFLKL
jgi:hypothetical protein